MNSAQQLFSKVYEQAQGAGQSTANQAGPDMNAGGRGNADDDVQDADFKEV